MTVNTRATQGGAHELACGRDGYVIQNKGPGKVAWGTSSDVTTSTGVLLEVGDVYEFLPQPTALTVWVTADTNGTDLRTQRL